MDFGKCGAMCKICESVQQATRAQPARKLSGSTIPSYCSLELFHSDDPMKQLGLTQGGHCFPCFEDHFPSIHLYFAIDYSSSMGKHDCIPSAPPRFPVELQNRLGCCVEACWELVEARQAILGTDDRISILYFNTEVHLTARVQNQKLNE